MADSADPAERRVLDHLRRHGVDHESIRIDPQHAQTAVFCEVYGYTLAESVNCIVVAAKTSVRAHVACLVQADRRLDVNGVVRKLMGVRKASFAPPDETAALTGMLPDGVTPFGLPDGLPVYVDGAVLEQQRVIVGGGSRALKLRVPATALAQLPGAQVVEGLARPA
ncbi:MAG TPA: YbaK/EbsC family protein [Egibacteraceae bacterium]|nr:YbaK/EbsC family protein [Egibacteraceae bacterium]